MRNKFLFLFFLFAKLNSFGQNDSTNFFPQINISFNRASANEQNTNNPLGFGIGLYIIELKDKLIKIKFGLEYNRINIFKSYLHQSHFSNYEDITYRLDYLSLPIVSQISFGSKIKVIIETGIYFDLNIGGTLHGTYYYYGPNASMTQLISKQGEVSQKVNLSPPDIGFALGVGIKVPISNYRIIISPEYKVNFTNEESYVDMNIKNIIRLAIGFQWNQ